MQEIIASYLVTNLYNVLPFTDRREPILPSCISMISLEAFAKTIERKRKTERKKQRKEGRKREERREEGRKERNEWIYT